MKHDDDGGVMEASFFSIMSRYVPIFTELVVKLAIAQKYCEGCTEKGRGSII